MLAAVSTVLALIFSVALLVLSMAVSQFGPRILYRFVADAVTQITIGLFLASFVHTLLTFVITRQEAGHQFVPQLTLTCSVLLVMLSFAVLVVFSHRIAMAIQTQNVVAYIVKDLAEALAGLIRRARVLPMLSRTPAAEAERAALVSRSAAEGGVVHAPRTGFIQEVDVSGLLATAERSDVLVHLLYRPGQFVITGAALVHVLPAGKTAALAPLILRAVRIGAHRTLKQDLEFGIAQVVEIALRALSPAVNDTFTGLTCVDWLADELRAFAASRAVDTGACLGASGSIRLVWPPIRFVRLVKTAFDQIRQAAAGNPAISIRLLQTLTRLADKHIEDAQIRQALGEQVEAIWEAVLPRALVEPDRADIEAAYTAARQALGAYR